MRTFRLMLIVSLLSAFAPGLRGQNMPSMDEMERQMLDMQQRLMQELRNSPLTNGSFFSDTTFFFRMDTLFDNGSAQFFQFGTPGGSDDLVEELDRMFNELFKGFGDIPGYSDQPRKPADDGEMHQSDDDLLPEEKLRHEKTEPSPGKKPKETPKPAKKQSIRI